VTCGPFNARAASRAISQGDGVAACCSAAAFGAALDASETLRQALSRFTEGLMAQVQQVEAAVGKYELFPVCIQFGPQALNCGDFLRLVLVCHCAANWREEVRMQEASRVSGKTKNGRLRAFRFLRRF
jgi:hypothetical protein